MECSYCGENGKIIYKEGSKPCCTRCDIVVNQHQDDQYDEKTGKETADKHAWQNRRKEILQRHELDHLI